MLVKFRFCDRDKDLAAALLATELNADAFLVTAIASNAELEKVSFISLKIKCTFTYILTKTSHF